MQWKHKGSLTPLGLQDTLDHKRLALMGEANLKENFWISVKTWGSERKQVEPGIRNPIAFWKEYTKYLETA